MKNYLVFGYICLLICMGCIGRNRCDCNYDPAFTQLNLRIENSEGQNLIVGPNRITQYSNMSLSYKDKLSNLVYNMDFQPVDFDTSGISLYPPSAAFYYFNIAFNLPSDTIGVYFRRQENSCCDNRSIFRVDINGVETKPDNKGFYVIKK